jgi:phosphopantothenoylcysteine decarboxylase/phosphopantothenate--cysteine ligase
MHPTKAICGSKGSSLKGKTIVLGITGSIAAVKCVELARELIRHGAEVFAVMTTEACRIIHPNSMHYATGNKAITELTGAIEHVEFCGANGKADLLLIAPATGNTIGKIINGIDDTTVTSFAATAIAAGKKIIVVPAMHETMYNNPFAKENIEKLEKAGIKAMKPKIEENAAKFPAIEEIVLECERALGAGLLKGKKVLIANGATQEDIDEIRVITSRASGLTGIEIAKECYRQGAEVSIVQNNESFSKGIKNFKARTSAEMEKIVLEELKKGFDLYISPAALADFKVEKKEGKIKSSKDFSLQLKPREKLLEKARACFPELKIIAFKAEIGVQEKELIEIAKKKLRELKASIVIANDVKEKGMGTIDNKVFIVSEKRVEKAEGLKSEIAKAIVKEISISCTLR